MADEPEPLRRGPLRGLTFVNVTFPGEMPLLRLQARSMGRYLPGDLVGEVLNIVNATNEAPALAELEAMRGDYGPLAGKVRNVTGSALFAAGPRRTGIRHLPKRVVAHNPWLYGRRRAGWRGNDGWQMQQAMKLAAARIAGFERIVILDSKNIFLAPISQDDFIAPDGRPFARYRRDNLSVGPLARRWLDGSLRALRLDPSVGATGPVLGFLTPAVFDTRFILDILDALEARQGPVEGVFAMPLNRATEFMLITGWCLKDGGLAQYFEEGLMDPFNLNYGHTEEFRLRRLREAVEGGNLVTPHRSVMTSLSPELREGLSALLVDRGVTDGSDDFDAVVEDLRRRNPQLPRQ